MDHDDLIHAAWAMERFGGHFMQALAKLIYKADLPNTRKIIAAWRDEIDEYLDIYNKRMKDEANG